MFVPRFLFVLVLCSLVSAYAPSKAKCPSRDSLLRTAKSISKDEQTWIGERLNKTTESYIDFLKNSGLKDFDDIESLVNNLKDPVSIAAAFSGGGYRAMLNGAGQLAALDSRTEGANEHGLGGLLDSMTYISGLSGGSWLLSSVVLHGWKSIQDIIDDRTWELSTTIFSPYNKGSEDLAYFKRLFDAAKAKKEQGFQITPVDIWGLAFAYQLFPKSKWDNLTWSGVRDLESFRNHDMPFPIITTLTGPPGFNYSDLDTITTEFNPYEYGSWHRYVNHFTDLKYLGTKVNNGKPVDHCVTGFDNAAFMMGTSSDVLASTGTVILFAAVSQYRNTDKVLKKDLAQLNDVYGPYAIYSPSPFHNFSNDENPFLKVTNLLTALDGGFSGESIPLEPLIQPIRGVSAVFAFDNSDNTDDGWPDGTSLRNTYDRIQKYDNGSIPFPKIPKPKTFLKEKLNTKPTFFGCNADADVPLVVYVPNTNVSYASNFSTLTLSFSNDTQLDIIRNGFEGATRNNLTDDSSYRTCVACATLLKSLKRNGKDVGDQCQECLSSYCYN